MPVQASHDSASEDLSESWIVASMSEFTPPMKQEDFQFDDAIKIPSSSESSSMVSAQSEAVGKQQGANPIVAAAKAAAGVVAEVAVPAAKVMVLASADVAEVPVAPCHRICGRPPSIYNIIFIYCIQEESF